MKRNNESKENEEEYNNNGNKLNNKTRVFRFFLFIKVNRKSERLRGFIMQCCKKLTSKC